MLSMRARFLASLAVCFCLSIVLADPRAVYIHRRDGPATPSTITDASKTQSSSSILSASGMNEVSSTISVSASSMPSVIISAVTSNINGPAPTSAIATSVFNETATPGKLPLTPEVTPAYAVAGVILMISGAIYTLVGIKNKHLHICLSAAYLASLGVTVLILYVMNPPVSNAIQGAYLVAVVMTGLILGGAAIVFSEMTEGLGCLLGGFSFSMWLLVLKPGGLLTSTSGKSGFIAVFTLVGFATSFSHITRPYALIGFVSFSGATVVVLGIDCVSRAGLKEFWAYIWNLNDNLFPVGVTTFPQTRGMKVEIAAIVILFLAGVMSQMKLWKVIKERREQRAAERLEDEQTIQREEESVGKRIEEHNAHEKGQWEAVYGDKNLSRSSNMNQSNRDSGVGDMDSQKKGATSTVTSLRRSRDEEIEMTEMPLPKSTIEAGFVKEAKGQDSGSITARIERDAEFPTVTDEHGNPLEQSERRLTNMSSHSPRLDVPEEDDVWVAGAHEEAQREQRPSKSDSYHNVRQNSAGPDIIPLPFKVPEGAEIEDDNSSLAASADDEPTAEKRNSKHLSATSAFLQRLSKRSSKSSKHFSTGHGNSTEDLVISRETDHHPRSRASSLAATMDELSDDESMGSNRSSIVHIRDEKVAALSLSAPGRNDASDLNLAADLVEKTVKRLSSVTLDSSAVDPSKHKENAPGKPAQAFLTLTSGQDKKSERGKSTEHESGEIEKPSNGSSSVASVAESKPTTLTKDNLPPKLSQVVMSYRTNEWAKHLSTAEVPDFEDSNSSESPADVGEKVEVAAPVNVEELQQTAENTPLASSRFISQISNQPVLTRSTSSRSKTYPPRPETSSGESLSRSSSQLSHHGAPQPQLLTRPSFRASTAIIPPIVESPIEDESVSNFPLNSRNPYGSQTTLIGQRDTMLRSKSSFYTVSPLASTPEISQASLQAQSQIPSVASQAGPDDGPEDETMPLSQRRSLLQRSQSQSRVQAQTQTLIQQPPLPFDSHQPRRQFSAPHPLGRESQLASFRASVQSDFVSATKSSVAIERQHSQLWMEKQAEEQRRNLEGRMREARDRGFDERMRRGDMLSAHRDALRKMQAKASGNT